MDYKLLMALTAVVEHGGFERAAQVLGLSQSAVSQRIKLLESRVGAPVLLRTTPPAPTPAGQRLLNHMQQVRLLERDLQQDIPMGEEGQGPARLRIALNADSLATWWAQAVAPLCEEGQLLFDLLTDDQEVGLRRMRSGEVAGCVCATPTPVAGARALKLGTMRYLAVARTDFAQRYFNAATRRRVSERGAKRAVPPQDWSRLPAIVFGPDDRLQHRFLADLGYAGEFPAHFCPSSEGFVRLLCAGMGWGMVPALQIVPELRSGLLAEIMPGRSVEVPLYWHYWRNGGRLLEQVTAQLASSAPRLLN